MSNIIRNNKIKVDGLKIDNFKKNYNHTINHDNLNELKLSDMDFGDYLLDYLS